MIKDSLINWGTKIISVPHNWLCHLSHHIVVYRHLSFTDEKEKAWGRWTEHRQRSWIDIQAWFVCLSWGTEEWGGEFIITPFQILWFKLTLAGPLQRQGKSPGDGGKGKVTSLQNECEDERWMNAGRWTVWGSNLSSRSEVHIQSELNAFILLPVALLLLLLQKAEQSWRQTERSNAAGNLI